MAFVPILEDVPTYFVPMLNDMDRNLAYANAIKETISLFVKEQKRNPRILDLGAGSGLLTLVALEHGAEHVTALEANSTLAGLLPSILQKHSPKKWTVANNLSVHFTLASRQQPFDMVICELLGSMIHSESMAVYLYDLIHKRKLVRAFFSETEKETEKEDEKEKEKEETKEKKEIRKKYYVVPNSATMTIRGYRCEEACGIVTGLPYAPMNTLYDAVYDNAGPPPILIF